MPARPLLKALTEAGIGSRRRLADAIRNGLVTVNGTAAAAFNQPVNTATDHVSVDGKPVDLQPKQVICLMLHKPAGILSTVSDERGRRTVMDILPRRYRHLGLHPVGRLDMDSTGLLLLTNDGDLTYRLTHPRFEYEKEYLVRIQGSLSPEEKRRLEHGLELEDGPTHPATIREPAASSPFNYSITVHEGRKRQVRRMFARLGHPVLALQRVRLGNLTLGDLKEGEVRRLSDAEVAALLKDRP